MYKFLWIDCEMSGLDIAQNQLLEIACILSDGKCTELVQGPELVLHASKEHLDKMDEWNTSHHNASGLVQKCIESTLNAAQAEAIILDFLRSKGAKEGQLILAGNSVHVDRLFIRKEMPKLNSFLHYRILDVTCLKIVAGIHRPDWVFEKKGSHRALDDIKESIGELNFYVERMFGAESK